MLLIRQERPFTLPSIFKILHSLSQKQPEKYLKLHFTGAGVGISTLDDSGSLLLGMEVRKQSFHSYIVEGNINLFLPVQKFHRILHLPTLNDDSITLSYEHDSQSQQLSIRIHSTKNNEKLLLLMKIESEFGEMISEKYEEPTNPIDYIDNLLKDFSTRMSMSMNQLSMGNNRILCQFRIPALQLARICSQFMQVSEKVVINYQSQQNSNKKYLTFSSYFQANTKSITLNEEKSIAQLEYEQSELYILNTSNTSKLAISAVFSIGSLCKIANIATDNEVLFNEDVRLVMEKGKCLLVVHELLGDSGRLVSMIQAFQT